MKLTLASDLRNPCHVLVEGMLRRGQHEVTEPLRTLVGTLAARTVLLDLSRTEGYDASGLCWLVESQKSLAQVGGELILLTTPASLRRALCLLGLATRFRMAESLPMADDMLAARASA